MIMEQLVFEDNKFLAKRDLQIGHVYVKKEGILLLYLGKDSWNRFVFYNLASVLFEKANEYNHITLAHYELQVNYLISLCDAVMHTGCNARQIVPLKNFPSLYVDFEVVDYSKEVNAWYAEAKKVNDSLPEIDTKDAANEKNTDLYVGAKELVPGELYYTGGLWRALYLYLGRDSQKRFCWYYVGNEEILMQNNISEYMDECERTKSNKKVKRLDLALKDPNVHLYKEARELIDKHWRADLSGMQLD